jgi:hypothetical protein
MTTTRQAVTHLRELRRFKSMYTLQGKPDTYDTHAFHFSPRTPLVSFLRAVPVRGNISCRPNRVGWMHYSWERNAPDSTSLLGWVARGTHLSFSLNTTIEVVCIKPSIYWWTYYINLLGTYLQHVISTFNTCSWGPTHHSLTDTGMGYNLRGAGLPHHTLSPSQPTIFCFPPRLPARSQVNQPNIFQLN